MVARTIAGKIAERAEKNAFFFAVFAPSAVSSGRVP
jgi:hypothetical protein